MTRDEAAPLPEASTLSERASLELVARYGVPVVDERHAATPADAVRAAAAFATPVVAFSVTRESDNGFAALNRFGVIPLFLFSGTFFPISQLPGWTQPLAYLTWMFDDCTLEPEAFEILVHRLEQSSLCLRRRAVDLVAEQEVGEDRARTELEVARSLIEDR